MILLKVFSRRWLLTTALVLAGAAVCARLGIWQLDRLTERRAFNAHVNSVRAMQPLQLPAEADSEDLTAMEYRPVQATGTYDFANQVAIRNQSYNDQYGYHLLTPLRMSNGQAVLVDRGWIPAQGNETAAAWRQYDAGPAATVQGIVRLSQSQAYFGGVTDPPLAPGQKRMDLWIYVNVERISKQLPYPIAPVYIELNPQDGRTDPPVPQQEELDLSEGPHEGYAIQWFSFATLLVAGYPFFVRHQEITKK